MKSWIQAIFYTPKHEKPTDENIFRLLLPSLAGIALCIVCLAGATWAWFTASVTTSPQTITTAHYDVTVSIGGVAIPAENETYTLQSGENTVKLTATGNASTGYCKILIDDKTYYTPQFPTLENSAKEFTFTVRVSKETEMTVDPAWGTYVVEDKQILSSDKPLDLTAPPSGGQNQANDITPPPEEVTTPGEADRQTYTVKEGDSLQKIAELYETTSEKLAAYNGIKVSSTLQIGQEIQIPPADYEIPAEPVTSNTEPEGSAPDTTSSQTADTEVAPSAASELSSSESMQTGGASHDNSAGE